MNSVSSKFTQNLTFGIASTLKKRPGVIDVDLSDHRGLDGSAVAGWENRNCCILPTDLKDFYLTTDGLLLTWKVQNSDASKPDLNIGRMEINSLSNLTNIFESTNYNLNKISLADVDYNTEDEERQTDEPKPPHFDSRCKCFEIDGCKGYGKVCLVYPQRNSESKHSTEIWFLDRSFRWWFITNSFTSYYRIMLMHLGLPYWHYALTSMGVPQKSKKWFNLYAPIRLRLNESEDLTSNLSTLDISPAKVEFPRVFKGKLTEKTNKQKLTTRSTTDLTNRKKLINSKLTSHMRSSRLSKPWT